MLNLSQAAWIGFFAGLVISVLCLPYFIYVLLTLLDQDVFLLGRKLIMLMMTIVLIVGLAGYTIGKYNRFFHDLPQF